jgi:hypothetical protein
MHEITSDQISKAAALHIYRSSIIIMVMVMVDESREIQSIISGA